MSSSAFTPSTNIANAATPSNDGFVSTGAQTFGGVKTFQDGINFGDQLLSKYSEGAVTLTGYTNVANTTAGTGTVVCTRIGRMVVGHFTFAMTNTANALQFKFSKAALTTAGFGINQAYFGVAHGQRLGSTASVARLFTNASNTAEFFIETDAVIANSTFYFTMCWYV